MKKSKVLLFLILAIFIFLICDYMSVSDNFIISPKSEEQSYEINIQDLIDYINSLELTEDKINEITEDSKTIIEDIKGKTAFSDYKIKEILKIYKNFNNIANNLNLKIDFSIKSGEFTLKEKKNGNEIFTGNVSEVKKYFKYIKDNTAISSLEVFSNIDNENLINNILDKVLSKESNIVISDSEKYTNENDLNQNSLNEEVLVENEVSSINNSSKNTKSFFIQTIMLAALFFITITAYIKIR